MCLNVRYYSLIRDKYITYGGKNNEEGKKTNVSDTELKI